LKVFLPSIIVIILDQITKFWIKNNLELWSSIEIFGTFIRFSHVKNTGLAFGISVGSYKYLIVILSFVATLFILYTLWNDRKNHPLIVSSYSLILGGALGNLIDRSYLFFVNEYQGVVDFIDIGFGNNRWYTFNIADTAITIGIFLYLIHSFLENKSKNIANND
tara:strand:+ start:242 stop:733 length:492 start_codon:yes stop_codon:yes gene_type:complete